MKRKYVFLVSLFLVSLFSVFVFASNDSNANITIADGVDYNKEMLTIINKEIKNYSGTEIDLFGVEGNGTKKGDIKYGDCFINFKNTSESDVEIYIKKQVSISNMIGKSNDLIYRENVKPNEEVTVLISDKGDYYINISNSSEPNHLLLGKLEISEYVEYEN